MGRLLAHIEINVKGRRALDQIYNRIDKVATGRLTGSPALDPFEAAPKLRQSVLNRFDALSESLSAAGVEHDCAERLVQYLRESPAQELSRLRPHALAIRLGVCADRLVEACLHACHAGLLELHWDILCPTCRVSSSVKDTLAEIDRHTHCEACDLDFGVDFGNSVELIFRVHPELRKADLATRCIGGPEHAPHVVAQARLNAGESLELDVSLDAGTYVLRGPQLPYTVAIGVRAAAGTVRATLPLSNTFDPARCPEFRAGRQLLLLENKYDRPLLVRIERTITRTDVLTALQASRLPLFKQLFPSEVLSRDQLSDFSTCTLLAIRAGNLADLCEEFGDAAAYQLTRERLNRLKQTIQAQGGHVVNESNEQLLGVFPETLNAVRVAVNLFDSAETADPDDTLVRLRAALHRGAALSTSVNGRLDYFGRTVTTVAQMLDATTAAPLALSAELSRDREVMALLDQTGLQIGPPVARQGARQGTKQGLEGDWTVFEDPRRRHGSFPATSAEQNAVATRIEAPGP
jgi:class 3 adenylate cyclase